MMVSKWCKEVFGGVGYGHWWWMHMWESEGLRSYMSCKLMQIRYTKGEGF